ncbi:MAG: LCP family protein [Clostridia bacterium]|nr:LCP family protein [Clostridia bacterium]
MEKTRQIEKVKKTRDPERAARSARPEGAPKKRRRSEAELAELRKRKAAAAKAAAGKGNGKKKKKKKKKKSVWKTILLVLLVLFLVAGLAVGGYFYKLYSTVRNNDRVEIVERPTDTPAPTPDPAATPAMMSFATIDPASITPEPTPEPTATPEPTPLPAPIYAVDKINDDIINILLVGIDPRAADATADNTGNSDSMMIVSVNKVTHRVCIFSIMRDGAAYIDDRTGWYDKINKAYSNGGVGMLINTLNGKNNFQLDIQNYISITFKMFEHIVDEFGGLDIYLTEEECRFINKKCQNEAEKVGARTWTTIPVQEGVQRLTGETTLWYCRDRYSSGKGDWGRTERQRKVILLMYEKMRTEWSVPKLMNIIEYVAQYSATNLSVDAIVQLATMALTNEFTIEQTTIPFPGTSSNGKNSKGRFVLTYDMPSTRNTLLGIIYNGDPMPTGEQTDFASSDED